MGLDSLQSAKLTSIKSESSLETREKIETLFYNKSYLLFLNLDLDAFLATIKKINE